MEPVQYTLVDIIGNGVLILLLVVLNTTYLIFWQIWFFQVCDVYFVVLRLIVTVAWVIVQPFLKKALTVSIPLVAACFVRDIRFFIRLYEARILYDSTEAVRLRSAADIKAESNSDHRYLALSYCWGTDKFLTLNKSNIESFQQGLEAGGLTKTFQEAI